MHVYDRLAHFSAAALANPRYEWSHSAIDACRMLDRRHAGMWRWATLADEVLTVWRASGQPERIPGEGPLTHEDLATLDAMLAVEHRSIVGVDSAARRVMVDRLPHGLVALRDALAVHSGQPAYRMPVRAVVDHGGRAIAAASLAIDDATVLDVAGERWRSTDDGVLYVDWSAAPPQPTRRGTDQVLLVTPDPTDPDAPPLLVIDATSLI